MEKRYGINIESFFLSGINFSAEIAASFETYRSAAARVKAAEPRLDLAKRYKEELGVSPQTAADEADLAIDPAVKKSIVSVQGEAGILGGAISGIVRKGEENASQG